MTYICHDCGIDTTPCTERRGCRHKGKWEHYMVHNAVWDQAVPEDLEDNLLRMMGMPGEPFYLCIGCLEARLGRTLCADDFSQAPINDADDPWKTPRLADRLRATAGQPA